MKRFIRRIAAVALASALLLPVSCSGFLGTEINAEAASKTAKLSKTSLTMTDSTKSYTIKLTTSVKKSKISWKASIKAGTAEGAEPCISMKVSKDKKKVTVIPLRNGKGTITCIAGNKTLKCSYTVKFPAPVESKFDNLTEYLLINGVDSNGDRIKDFGKLSASNATCSVYGYYLGSNSIRFDIAGSYNDTSDYFTVSFFISRDGNVSDVKITERVGHVDIYKASVTSRAASAFTKGCKKVNFYTEIQPGATQYLDSCESMAQKNFDISLQCIDQYLNNTLGYGVRNIGFINYK